MLFFSPHQSHLSSMLLELWCKQRDLSIDTAGAHCLSDII